MDRGFIKIWRKSLETQAFQNSDLWKVWTWCLIRASHRERHVPIITGRGASEVHLLPGQFVYGRKTAARDLNMPPSSIRNRMNKLRKMGNIEINAHTHYSLVTICNWGIYQHSDQQDGHPSGQPKDNQRTPIGQAKGTYKNDENVKKDKKKSIQKENPYPTDLQG